MREKLQIAKKLLRRKNVQRATALAIALVITGTVTVVGIQRNSHSSAAATWMSGACCDGTTDGSFGNWRGESVPISATWCDTREAAASLWSLDEEYSGWGGDVDIAVGAIFEGQSWSAAASGSYDSQWRNQLITMRNKWGNIRTMYIRFAHELNGNWYDWSVSSGDANNFKQAWIRYHNLVQQELVSKGKSAKLTMSFNKDPVNSATPEQVWPGNQYVDVVGVDFYDMYPSYPNQGAWDSHYNATKNGSPYGINSWRKFAESKGKPLAFSEWGVMRNQGGDNPFFIEKMHEFFSTYGGTGAGNVLYETYFNTWDDVKLYPSTNVPNSAAKYRSLTWGGSGGTTPNPNPPTPNPNPPTPNPNPPTGGGQISQTNNLATGKTFTSSVGDHPTEVGNTASMVNDQNESSRWISAPSDNVTLSTDLGSTQTLNKVSILWAGDTTNNYELQMSADESSWTTIASGTTSGSSPQLIDTTSFSGTASGRYFRVVATDRHNMAYGNSIFEIGLYGSGSSGGGDSTPPSVSLTAPANNSSAAVGSAVTITANAGDNSGTVAKVEFFSGTQLLGTDTSTPFSFNWSTAGQTTGAKTLTAKAYDGAGNTRVSAAVTLNLTGSQTNGNGDVNGDGRVNGIDYSVLSEHDGQNYPAADFNKDGIVGAADLAILLARWTW